MRSFSEQKRVFLALRGCAILAAVFGAYSALAGETPPPWTVLPLPRSANYAPRDGFLPLKNVAIVRGAGGPYETQRDARGELTDGSAIIEEELTGILKELGVAVASVNDTEEACAGFDTLILLGPPSRNAQTAVWFARLGLSFDKWDDANTPEDDFKEWPDFGTEGYLLKTTALDGKTVIVLAGYDFDAGRKTVRCAGTFYALQSFRQLLVKRGDSVEVKAVEIADKPLVAVRGCYSGFDPSEEQERRNIVFMAQLKANQDVYWYGNALAGYNGESAGRFRYPWKPEQLDCYRRIGKYCREHFITMVFCMNPDHYNVDWAAARSFDGTRKDPLHYDLSHPVEAEFKELWKGLGFEVANDVDILAAKVRQLEDAVPGAIVQIMNEDDVFGLVHEADKALFKTQTGDALQDAINYGRARGQFLAALYKRIGELCPEYPGVMPICPPNQVCYQLVTETNEHHSRDFLASLGATLKELGLQDAIPVITTGGGTAAEVVTNQKIDDFRNWCAGSPALICDNNFPQGFHIGAYETDPAGPRFAMQVNVERPSGYRDKDLYQRLWGIHWNGMNDQHVLGWCQSQYMWNMLAIDRTALNALATRKVCSAEAYPAVKAFYEEFDNPGCYLPDNQPPLHVFVVSNRVAFRSEGQNGWQYAIRYADAIRREAQRLCGKLAQLKPELERRWDSPLERTVSLKYLGDRAYAFCSVYLAYGYLKGWEDATPEARLEGKALRDLYLEADDIQERFFSGPDDAPGRTFVDRSLYASALRFLYTDGKFEAAPESKAKAARYVDIWGGGLRNAFFTPAGDVFPAMLADGDAALSGAWDPAKELDGERFRAVSTEGTVALPKPVAGPVLVRVRLGTEGQSPTEGTPVVLEAGGEQHSERLCKPRWINWFIPAGKTVGGVGIKGEQPVQVYAIEVYTPVAEK